MAPVKGYLQPARSGQRAAGSGAVDFDLGI